MAGPQKRDRTPVKARKAAPKTRRVFAAEVHEALTRLACAHTVRLPITENGKRLELRTTRYASDAELEQIYADWALVWAHLGRPIE